MNVSTKFMLKKALWGYVYNDCLEVKSLNMGKPYTPLQIGPTFKFEGDEFKIMEAPTIVGITLHLSELGVAENEVKDLIVYMKQWEMPDEIC